MNPRNELLARTRRASQAKPDKTKQLSKDAARVRTHGHRAAQRDLPRARSDSREKRLLPTRSNIDAEPPARWAIPLIPADLARIFVHRAVQSMEINRRRARIHPKPSRMSQSSDSLPKHQRALNPRLLNRSSIFGSISATYIAPGEIDDNIGTLQFGGPISQRSSIPLDHAPRGRLNRSRDHHDLMTAPVEMACEQSAYLSIAARKNDAKRIAHRAASGKVASSP